MKQFNNKPNSQHVVDGKIIWNSRSSAVVGCIVAKMGFNYYVLINKRGPAAADYQGYFNLPCGYLDYDECGTEGITREVWEETGVDMDEILANNKILVDYFTDQPFFVNTSITENRQNISLSYGLVFDADQLPKTTTKWNEVKDEVSEVKWVNINDLSKYEFCFNHDGRINYFLKKINILK